MRRRSGRNRNVDRFDEMSEGELAVESMMIYCVTGGDGFGYPFIDPDLYGEWREWSLALPADELRDWVRRNSTASE